MPSGQASLQGAYEGMTLRDYFAAQALSALVKAYFTPISGKAMKETFGENDEATCLAEMAYEVGEAMLKARES